MKTIYGLDYEEINNKIDIQSLYVIQRQYKYIHRHNDHAVKCFNDVQGDHLSGKPRDGEELEINREILETLQNIHKTPNKGFFAGKLTINVFLRKVFSALVLGPLQTRAGDDRNFTTHVHRQPLREQWQASLGNLSGNSAATGEWSPL